MEKTLANEACSYFVSSGCQAWGRAMRWQRFCFWNTATVVDSLSIQGVLGFRFSFDISLTWRRRTLHRMKGFQVFLEVQQEIFKVALICRDWETLEWLVPSWGEAWAARKTGIVTKRNEGKVLRKSFVDVLDNLLWQCSSSPEAEEQGGCTQG